MVEYLPLRILMVKFIPDSVPDNTELKILEQFV